MRLTQKQRLVIKPTSLPLSSKLLPCREAYQSNVPGLGEMITTSLPPDAPVPDVDCPVKHERKARSGQNKVILLESVLDYSRSSFQRN